MRSPLLYLPAILIITSTFSSCGIFKTATERNLTYRSMGSFPSKTPPSPPIMFPKGNKQEANLSRSLDASAVSAASIVSMAKTFLGTPYVSGGVSKEGTDCSGLVYACFGSAGLRLPRTSRDMAEFGTPIEDKSDIRMGDLVFFDSNNAGKINHVGMVTNVATTDANFIHASSSKGVIESSLLTGYWLDKHRKTVRILPIDDINNPAKYNPAAAAVANAKKEPKATPPPPKKESPKPISEKPAVPKKETVITNNSTTEKLVVPKKETTPSTNTVAKPAVPKKELPKTQPAKRLEGEKESEK